MDGGWRGTGGGYDGMLKSCAWERRDGHRGEIRLRGSEGKPNPSPSQKHPKTDYLLQQQRRRGRTERERSIDAILAQSSDLIFDLL